ncbi:MAG: hypothetical protein WAP03_19245 [Methylorubrum rhodinum]|uniref:hypothetical protein n=1 Tax=Methylorubrum rhodinum TaxID=29428 RepID=UPI003BAE89A7
MPADIYAQRDRAFAQVSAYVVCKNGERVATVAIRRVQSVTAFIHWIGLEMVAGRTNGGGYDMASAACGAAARKAITTIKVDPKDVNFPRATFFRELRDDDGRNWIRRLEDAGFQVFQAV